MKSTFTVNSNRLDTWTGRQVNHAERVVNFIEKMLKFNPKQ